MSTRHLNELRRGTPISLVIKWMREKAIQHLSRFRQRVQASSEELRSGIEVFDSC